MTPYGARDNMGEFVPVQLSAGLVQRLDDLIERLIAFRDAIDGDSGLEEDGEDCCEVHDDNPGYVKAQACVDGPGDADDAEEGGDLEDAYL